VVSGVASFSTYRSSRLTQTMGASSPASSKSLLPSGEMGFRGLSRSSVARAGISSSRRPVRLRRIRLLAWPRVPRRMKFCLARMAWTRAGITVSS
jgi:hypothetical protein